MTENSVTLDMDETRELRWTFGAIKTFEKRGREILKRLDIKNERGQQIATAPMHAGYILANYLKISEILEAAVAATGNLNGLEGKKGEPSEATTAIEGYIERGGSISDLEVALYRAWAGYEGPSHLAEYNISLEKEAEIKRINLEKQAAKMEIARMELSDDQKKIERLRKISGQQSTE
jgi:hypothetical protein